MLDKNENALPLKTGVGFKPQHFNGVMADEHEVGWFEVHAENYMVSGGPKKRILSQLADRYPISCHGVGLSIGSPQPLDQDHLERLKTLLGWLNPAMFSEHLAWSSHNQVFLNDLLPLPYTQKVLDTVVEHIDQVQEFLGRRMLLENPSTYISFATHEMPESAFISEITRRTGCGLLLDVNNVYISSINQAVSPFTYLAEMPMDAVGEYHLAGHTTDQDDAGNPLLIDSHNAMVADDVWSLYRYVISTYGLAPTLVEWDNNVPDWPVLANEARRANQVIREESGVKTGVSHVA